MSKRDMAVAETQSVLSEMVTSETRERRGPGWHNTIAEAIVDRLIAKGVIQSTDPEELGYRTGPLEPGRKRTGAPAGPVQRSVPEDYMTDGPWQAT